MTWTVILDELTNYLVIFFCFIRPDWILFDIWLSNIVKSRDNIRRYRLTRIGNESINQFETLKIKPPTSKGLAERPMDSL